MAKKQVSSAASLRAIHPGVWLVLLSVVIVGSLLLHISNKPKVAMVICDSQNLTLSTGQQSGAAGTIYQHIIVRNTGVQACLLTGYPTIFLQNSEGYVVGLGAAARPNPVPVTITLNAGGSAYSVAGYPQAGNFNPGVCSAKSAKLSLFPPSSTAALTVPLEVEWCPGFSMTAFQPGS